ncbi:uncharacterized protein DFL_002519 [Arthrobotrys flagrans]|uniref:Telomere-associated protein Rif1 N-terminal domain-containing protein n=1 Tax=Arthrobotrys flagrans TaxID=97331 RepID=A0A437AC04_ARTFL|nr:hypothetical protein DFL_002519 [Arthrobotrys flagrans]
MTTPSIPESRPPSSPSMDVTMEDEDANSNELDNVVARPPTPPKHTETITNGAVTTASSSYIDETPTSSAETAPAGQDRRVNFSPYINWHQPWKYDTEDAKYPPIKSISLSAKASRPVKSILKPFEKSIILITEQIEGLDPDNPMADTNTPFGELLESIVQILASSDRTKKSDTYGAFATTLRAYDGVPDVKLLADKLDLILSFIRRDFNARIPDVGTPDTTLIRQACKVLIIFSYLPETVTLIPEEDINYFLNFAIDVLDQGTSKALSTNYMYFLSQQKFSPRIMTTEKVTRILQVSSALKDKQKGNSIDLERLSLYAKLLAQAKGAMVQNAELWVDHVFQGLISTATPIRTRALTIAQEMERELGGEKQIARAVMRLFPTKKDIDSQVSSQKSPQTGTPSKSQTSTPTRSQLEDSKKRNFIQNRLEKMLETKTEAVFVPQIWGITISLLRGLTIPIDRWENFSPFLGIMSKCLNSSEQNLNVFAQIAWAKLIFVSDISTNTSKKNFDLLLRPAIGYIDEAKGSRHTKHAKKAAITNIHTMLYYGCRPGTNFKQLGFFWEALVEGVVAKYLLTSNTFLISGCNILSALFGGNTKWTENRVLEGTYIAADEIPRLDPKWIRANSTMIFKTLEVAVRSCLKTKKDNEIPHLAIWKKLMAAIAEAAKKEIRISAEMMEFVASLLGFLKRLWTDGFRGKGPTLHEDSQFLTHFVILVQLAIQELGTACFTEKWLAEDGTESFLAISTPSGKFSSGSNHVVQHQPIWHLFRLFIDPFKGARIGENYARPISNILSTCVEAQDSRRKKLSLLAQGIAILPTQDISQIHLTAWTILANICDRVIPRRERDTMPAGGLVNGPEIRDALTILEWGYQFCGPEQFIFWKKLYQTVYQTVQQESGIAYLGPALIDPLSESMRLPKIDAESTDTLQYINALASSIQYPTTTVQYDRVYKSLFGDQAKKHTQIPYTTFFEVMGQAFWRTIELSQVDLSEEGNTDIIEFFDCMREVTERLPKESVAHMVSRMQDGFSLWLSCEAPADKNIIEPMQELLKAVCEGLKRTECFHSNALKTFSHLIAAGFESKHKMNVVTTINFWNKTFGNQESLEYPSRVRKAISKIRYYADIKLPTFPDSLEDEANAPPPTFLDTQISDFAQHILSSPPKAGASPLFYRDLQAPVSAKSSKASSNPSKQSYPKLRHMDSQVEYKPIYADENDDPDAMESQLMTDRQKEVRDRQARESDLFRDLNSGSPSKHDKTNAGTSGLPLKLDLRIPNPTSDAASSPALDRVMSSSPGLPTLPISGKFAALIDRAVHFPTSDDLPSSPTARVSRDPFMPLLEDIPSSPPLAPVNSRKKEDRVDAIDLGDGEKMKTVDPRKVELSQGSKLRIETGELPPNLTEVVKDVPKSPSEAIALQLQEYERVEGVVIEPVVEEERVPSQVEDISVHLNSQMDEDMAELAAVTEEEGEKGVETTAPENPGTEQAEEGIDESELESVCSIPDSQPSRAPRSPTAESRDPTPTSSQSKGHKRKRSKGQPIVPPTQDSDHEMVDCVAPQEEPAETSAIPAAKEEDEIPPPPAKKAKAATGDVSLVAPARQLPPRARRSMLGNSATGATGVQEPASTRKGTTPPRQVNNSNSRSEKKKTGHAGLPGGPPARRGRPPSAASSLSVPDSQPSRRGRGRHESTGSLPSMQELGDEIALSVQATPVKKSVSPEPASDFQVVVTNENPTASLLRRLDSLLEEMKDLEFSPDELTKIDGTAFNIMHWVRDKQQQLRAGRQ